MPTRKAGDTLIRWAAKTWNPTSGCTRLSKGCDNCYAFEFAERHRGQPAFPVGFDLVQKPHKLRDPYRWKEPADVFVNSMSDLYHRGFDRDFIDQVHDVIVDTPQHVYICLTKRPKLMAEYILGKPVGQPVGYYNVFDGVEPESRVFYWPDGYLARRRLQSMPENYWPGVTIEDDGFAWRADVLRTIPTLGARTISAEPLLGPLPSLDLRGLGWVIVGGESGGKRRPMDDDWARDLRDRCAAAGVPFFFKQHSAFRSEQGIELDGVRIEQRPPSNRFDLKARATSQVGLI